MPALPTDLVAEVRRVLGELAGARLAPAVWPAVHGDLDRLTATIQAADPTAVRAALLPLSRSAFEGKVRGRLAHADGPAAVVVATKPTSALPAVGAVSAALLIGIGYLLGGWVIAALAGVFALFIFGVALAGTRTTKERLERRGSSPSPPTEPPEPAPAGVGHALTRIEALL